MLTLPPYAAVHSANARLAMPDGPAQGQEASVSPKSDWGFSISLKCLQPPPSALGHKLPQHLKIGMSALPLKAAALVAPAQLEILRQA